MSALLPDQAVGAVVTLFGAILLGLFGFAVKEYGRRTTLISSNIDAMLKGYHELITDMKVMLEAARNEIDRTVARGKEDCAAQLLDLEMTMFRELKEQQDKYQAQITELELRLKEVTVEFVHAACIPTQYHQEAVTEQSGPARDEEDGV